MEYKYNAFLSYSHKDKKIVKRIQNILENQIPNRRGNRRNGLKVFRDETHLSAGELTELIRENLNKSEYLIVFCSNAAWLSEYVYQEIEFFLRKFTLDDQESRHDAFKHILFVGLEKTDPKNKSIIKSLFKKALITIVPKENLEDMLHEVSNHLYVNFGEIRNYERIRKERVLAYKLAAAVLGTDLDDLCRRAERRRHRVIAGTVTSIVLITALAYFSLSVYPAFRDREARMIALAAESELKDGNRLLASQLALATTERKLLYRTVVPEAISVMTDAVRVYDKSDTSILQKVGNIDFNYTKHISMDISPSGKYVAAINEANDLILWDVEHKKQAWEFFAADSKMDSKIRFIDDNKLLVYTYFECKCFDTKTGKQLWENLYEISAQIVEMIYGDESQYSMKLIKKDNDTDGLANLNLFERNSKVQIACMERHNGIVIRNVDTGTVDMQLTREEIKHLLPENVLCHHDLNYAVQRYITMLEDSKDIHYDSKKDRLLFPCYNKKTDKDGKIYDSFPGVIEWNLKSESARYVSLQYADQKGQRTDGIESIMYVKNGIILKILRHSDHVNLCAFDGKTGREIWYRSLERDTHYSYDDTSLTSTQNGNILLLAGQSVLVIDPETGKDIQNLKADLRLEEYFAMILNKADAVMIITSDGRICYPAERSLFIGEESTSLTANEINKWEETIYVPSNQSFSGSGIICSTVNGGISLYEEGFTNERYKQIAVVDSEGIGYRGAHVYSLENDQLLVKDADNVWELYDFSGSKPELRWRITVSEIEEEENENFEDGSLKKLIEKLVYVGTEPGSGELLLYEQNFYGFVRIVPQTGEIRFEHLPSLYLEDSEKGESTENARYLIESPVVTARGLAYISTSLKDGSFNVSLYSIDTFTNEYTRTTIPTKATDSERLKLITDPSGQHAVIIGLPEGPYLVDTEEMDYRLLNPEKEENNDFVGFMNSFMQYNSDDATCVFSDNGKYVALNYNTVNMISIYDMEGSVTGFYTYFNMSITDMIFTDRSLLMLTDTGKILSKNLKNNDIERSVSVSDKNGTLTFAAATPNDLWVRDSLSDDLYCINPVTCKCFQIIRGIATVDSDKRNVITYTVHGGKTELGCLPLLTSEEIIDLTRQYVGDRELSDVDKLYYGIDY